jgi:hypothetical protein
MGLWEQLRMATTAQTIQTINTIVSLSSLAMQLYNQMATLDNLWSDESVATVIAAMNTAPLSADGTQSTTPDGTPNAAHPIMLSAYPGLSRALSSTQITQSKTILDAIASLIGGNAVSAQSGARAILTASS